MRALLLAGVIGFGWAGAASAAVVQFVPPNDTSGMVYSTNDSDGYDEGRGIVFGVTANTTITSVGLYQNLTNVNLSYVLEKVSSLTGQVDINATLLASGSMLANTSGSLAFVDFQVPNVTLLAGNNYYIDFKFTDNSNQNFYYNNSNVAFTQGAFTAIDGTEAGNTANFIMPAIRVSTLDVTAVPEPASLALLGMGLAGMVAARRRRQA